MNWFDKLERKFGRFAIKGLMIYIIVVTACVFMLDWMDARHLFLTKIGLDPALVLKGEVWRLITYIFIPPTDQPLLIIFALYFYYMFGTALEHEWGSFRFNVYYLIGMIGTTIAAFLTGNEGTALYLNLSLLLAFARLFPDFQILLFFVLPVKIKYIAWFQWAFLAYTVVFNTVPMKIIAVVSIINYFIFFGKDIVNSSKRGRQTHHNRQRFISVLPKREWIHKCSVCGITEKDNPNIDFRYCVGCSGDYEYCWDHLHSHEHIKGG